MQISQSITKSSRLGIILITFIVIYSFTQEGARTSYIRFPCEVLEFTQVKDSMGSITSESKVLYNKNGRLFWNDREKILAENYNEFNFSFHTVNGSIQLDYANSNGKNQSIKYFPLKNDTLEYVYFDDLKRNFISYTGEVYFKGSSILSVGDLKLDCYIFEIDEGLTRTNPRKKMIHEYYLSKKYLIPLQIIYRAINVTNNEVVLSKTLLLTKIKKANLKTTSL